MAAQYISHEAAHDNSMSTLHTPVSLVEYALRREAFGEGMLAVTKEGALTAGATQKYPHLQKKVLAMRKELGSFRSRMLEIDPPIDIPNPPLTHSAAPLKPPSRWQDANIPANIGVRRRGKGEAYSLHGELGTGNDYSAYVFKEGDRSHVFEQTLPDRLASRITNEERKVMRMQIGYALRRVKNLTSQERVRQYLNVLEKHFIHNMHANKEFKLQFFSSEEFAQEVCKELVDGVVVKGSKDLTGRLFQFRKSQAMSSIPEIEEQVKRIGRLNKEEAKLKAEPIPHVPLTDAGQLTRGRRNYQRWDFDSAISCEPPSEEKEENFVERYTAGKAALLGSVTEHMENVRNERKRKTLGDKMK